MSYASIHNTDWVVENDEGKALTNPSTLREAYRELEVLEWKGSTRLHLRSGSEVRHRNPDWPDRRSLGFWQDTIREYDPLWSTLELLRSVISNPMVVAGGALRDLVAFEDPSRIKDIDVFVLGIKTDKDLEDLFERISLLGGVMDIARVDPRLRATFDERMYFGDERAVRGIVAEFPCPAEPAKPLQIVASTADSVEELLAHFDWTVCKFAYDGQRIWADGMKDFSNRALTLNWTEGKNLERVLRRGIMIEQKLSESKLPLHLSLEEVGKLVRANERIQRNEGRRAARRAAQWRMRMLWRRAKWKVLEVIPGRRRGQRRVKVTWRM